jgi:hypothetical protein
MTNVFYILSYGFCFMALWKDWVIDKIEDLEESGHRPVQVCQVIWLERPCKNTKTCQVSQRSARVSNRTLH